MGESDSVLGPEMEAWLAIARQPGNRDRAAAQLRQWHAELTAAPAAAALSATAAPEAAPPPEPAGTSLPLQLTPEEAPIAAAALAVPAAMPTALPAASQPASGPQSSSPPVVCLALLGAGLFAQSAYLPFLQQHPHEAQLVAVWSRSQVSAAQLLAQGQG